jgi:hypothetical protein
VNLIHERVELGAQHTMGSLTIDDEWQCWILEDKVRELPGVPVAQWKIRGLTAIPAGAYEVRVTPSARFKRDLPELLNVPGFTGIRIHPGNLVTDTEGCLLPGLDRYAMSVGRSRLAFEALFTRIRQAIVRKERITWEIV